MKFIFSFLFFLLVILGQAQNNDSIQRNQQQTLDAQALAYMKYKKYMYIDYMPKSKIPGAMKKNFYSDLAPSSYTHNIEQQLDTINQIHRLYITTAKAGQGFLEINKGALANVPVDEVSEIVYIVDNDTVKTFKQMSDLVTLTASRFKKAGYKRTSDNKLMINVNTQQ